MITPNMVIFGMSDSKFLPYFLTISSDLLQRIESLYKSKEVGVRLDLRLL